MNTFVNMSFSSSLNTSSDIMISKVNLSDLGVECLTTMGYRSLTQLGLLFYVHNPYDHFFENVKDVRNYEIWVSFCTVSKIFKLKH